MPLNKDERIDEKGMRHLVRYVLDGGVHGVFVLGATGAFNLLEDEEKGKTIEIVVDEVKRKIPVIAGGSDTTTKRVIRNAGVAQRIGVDDLAILPTLLWLI